MKFDTFCLMALAVLIMASCQTNESRMKDYEFLRGPTYGQTTADIKNPAKQNLAPLGLLKEKPLKAASFKPKFLALNPKPKLKPAKYAGQKMKQTFKGLIMPPQVQTARPETNRAVIAGDQLRIRVYREDDLSNVFNINEGGVIDYPLIGQLNVQNLTPAQIAQDLKTKLKGDYLINPTIMVDRVQFCTEPAG